MADFKVGDRVLVAENARFCDGSNTDAELIAGPATVTSIEDEDGDLRVKPDGSEYSYYVGVQYVTREPKIVALSEIKVGDKIRVTDTFSDGDIVIRIGVVTVVTGGRVETATQLFYTDPKRTFEILESAPEPKKFKVGDTVEGQSNYDLLPVGTFLAIDDAGDRPSVFRTYKGWVNVSGDAQAHTYVTRTIFWLPEEKENA